MSSLRVLVCGSEGGRAYVSALRQPQISFSLAGILGNENRSAHGLALASGVPFHDGVDLLPETIDLACAAPGPDEQPLVMQVLGNEIEVVSPAEYQTKPAVFPRPA